MVLTISLFSFDVSGQINVNTIKNGASKVTNKNNKSDDDKNNSSTDTKGSYSSLMDSGAEKEKEGDYLSALKFYKAALDKKSGDYSASQKVKAMESSVESQYMTKLSEELDNGNCDQAQADLDSVMSVMGYWGQENYYRGQIDKCKSSSSSSNVSNGTAFNSNDADAGKILYYTQFKDYQFSQKVTAADELFAKINLGKTMMEYSSEIGLSSTFNAYGFFKFYINGKEVLQTGPYQFTSNYSKVWTDFDIALTINSDFPQQLQQNPDLLSTNQDIWLLQQMYLENSINVQFTIAEIQNLKKGENTIKIEFGLGESDAKTPSKIIASGEVKISMDDNNKKELYKRGPKYMRPLEDSDVGNFKYTSGTLNVGSGSLTGTLELPQSPKFYNMYWCKATSCDYDHGFLNFYAELDGEFLAYWTTEFDGDAYDGQKSFKFTILPSNDKDIENGTADFNMGDLFARTTVTNPLPYALLDLIYSGQMKAGNHSLKIKVYSSECIPYDVTFENTKEYHNQWPSIAETTVNLNITDASISSISNSSVAKKLSHASGEWVAVDSYLKTNTDVNGGSTLLDIATTTQWKVTVDVLGIPVYRTCKADILYKTTKGAYRIIRSVEIKEDYNGGTYSKPYVNEIIDYNMSGGMLSPIHFPVPGLKVK